MSLLKVRQRIKCFQFVRSYCNSGMQKNSDCVLRFRRCVKRTRVIPQEVLTKCPYSTCALTWHKGRYHNTRICHNIEPNQLQRSELKKSLLDNSLDPSIKIHLLTESSSCTHLPIGTMSLFTSSTTTMRINTALQYWFCILRSIPTPIITSVHSSIRPVLRLDKMLFFHLESLSWTSYNN